ncbi:MAG: aminoacyl-tRNA hydrolase [Candidatus Omnitrophota bacterium]
MKLIVGLGNPGSDYVDTRHNIGFCVLRALAKKRKTSFKKETGTSSQVARVRIGQETAVLALPQTFMNTSGSAVARLVRKHKIAPQELLVVCDDLDLEFDRMKLRPSGSSGGHRGLESIIEVLQNNGFARLRIGVGRPPEGRGASEHVLLNFNKKERTRLGKVIKNTVACMESWVVEGISKTMNTFNRKGRIQ